MKRHKSHSKIPSKVSIQTPETQKKLQNIGTICELAILLLIFGAFSAQWLLSGGAQESFHTQGLFILSNFYIFGASFILHIVLMLLKRYKRALLFKAILRMIVWTVFVINLIENQLFLSSGDDVQNMPAVVYSTLGAYIFIMIQQSSISNEIVRKTAIYLTVLYMSLRLSLYMNDPVLAFFGACLCLIFILYTYCTRKLHRNDSSGDSSKTAEILLLKLLLSDIEEGYMVMQSPTSIHYSNQALFSILDCTPENWGIGLDQIKRFDCLSQEGQTNLRNQAFESLHFGKEHEGKDSPRNIVSFQTGDRLDMLKEISDRKDIEFAKTIHKKEYPYVSHDKISTFHSNIGGLTPTKSKSGQEPVKKHRSSLRSSILRKYSGEMDKNNKTSFTSFAKLHTNHTNVEQYAKYSLRNNLFRERIFNDTKFEDILNLRDSDEYIFRGGISRYFEEANSSSRYKDAVSIDPSLTLEQLSAAMAKSSKHISEHVGYLTNLQNQTKLLSIKTQPLFLHGKFTLVLRVKDITEKEYCQNARQQESDKSNMLSSVSHELRTPLNCIITMLEILEDSVSKELKEDYVQPAAYSAKLLLSLVNDILDFSQSNAKKLKLVYSYFNLKQHLLDVIKLMNVEAKAKGLDLLFDFDDQAPVKVYSEPNRLRQIIINLIGNALKFTLKGSITLKVDYMGDNAYRISVIDTGVGIRPENIRRLFRQFSKIMDTSNINQQGVGLGLAISNVLAKMLSPNGKGISVDSTYGSGTTFSFEVESKIAYNSGEMEEDLSCDDEGSKQLAKNMTGLKDQAQNAFTQLSRARTSHVFKTGISRISSLVRTITIEKEEVSISSVQLRNDQTSHEFSQQLRKDRPLFSHRLPSGMTLGAETKSYLKSVRVVEAKEFEERIDRVDERVKVISKYLNKTYREPCILVVDDNTFNIIALARLLEGLNFKVDSAVNGDEAIVKVLERREAFKSVQNNYKLILMDCSMPVKDGYETTKEIRSLEAQEMIPRIPVIAVSAGNFANDINTAFEAGMNDYIEKPVNVETLKRIIVKYLEEAFDRVMPRDSLSIHVDIHSTRNASNKKFGENNSKFLYSKCLFQFYPTLINTNKKKALCIKNNEDPNTKKNVEQRRVQDLTVLQQNLVTEFKINYENFKKVAGQPVSFGQAVQFLHIASNKFLSYRHTEAELEKQNYKIGLDEYSNDATMFRFMPCYKH